MVYLAQSIWEEAQITFQKETTPFKHSGISKGAFSTMSQSDCWPCMFTTVNINHYELTEAEVLYSIGTSRIKINPRIKRDQDALVALVVKNLPSSAGDLRNVGLIPELGRSPGEGNDNLLQYSCLENPVDRGDWLATVHLVAKNWTRLKQISANTHRGCPLAYHSYSPFLN